MISRYETRSSRYRPTEGFPDSAPSPGSFTGKPFDSGLSWLSYSQSPHCSAIFEPVTVRHRRIAARWLPTPAALKGHHSPQPHGRDSRSEGATTRFEPSRPSDKSEGFPLSPLLREGALLDRTLGLLFIASCEEGLLERASIELDEPFSWHPARRADSLARSNPHPLRSAGEANFTECCPLTNFAGIALALTDVYRTMFCGEDSTMG